MNKLKLALGAQLLFFLVWAGWLMTSKNAPSEEFYLETTPVDPRDLLAGTFVALNYQIGVPQGDSCRGLMNSALSLYVKLEHKGRTARIETETVPIYESSGCSAKEPGGAGWARAGIQPAFGGRTTARYGIEKFYLNENDPRKDAVSGSVIARVKIDGRHQLVLLDLVKKF
ncbi:MAG: hypothetical protein COT18_10515 [Elusimicrobia bacterium CG08_land_8_20_14_0_20_59_10]|nr:MAG: hypothetical protein COT18_10515 [Elusimicrobia bacterium CG08_land_8_20_14_0_20_59_10]